MCVRLTTKLLDCVVGAAADDGESGVNSGGHHRRESGDDAQWTQIAITELERERVSICDCVCLLWVIGID